MVLREQKGIALPLVLITMIVLGLLGTVVLQFGTTDAKQTARDVHSTQAYYAARAGADAMAEHLIKNPNEIVSIANKTSPSQMAAGELTTGQTFEVDVFGDPDAGVTIMATGESNGVIRRVGLELARMDAAAVFEDVIYTYADLDVSQMKTIEGDVTSAGDIITSPDYDGTATPDTWRYYPSPDVPENLPTHPVYGLNLSIDNHYTATINDNYYFSSISMQPQGKLVFETTGDEVLQVVIDQFLTRGNVLIDTSAGGRVELFITGSADIQTPLVVNSGDPNDLVIYLADGAKFNMIANGTTHAYIYGPYAEVAIQSAHSTVLGAIVADLVVRMPDGLQPSIGNVIFHPIDDAFGPLPAVPMMTRNLWRDIQ